MLVAHLIGGNEVKVRIGDKVEEIRKGIVIINDEQLETRYEDLASVCGNISLGDLDTTQDERYIRQDYIRMVRDVNEDLGADFVDDNHLTEYVCYSEYEIDFENKTLTLKIDTYN